MEIIGDLFLFKPQPFGTNYNGAFVPFNVTAPSAPAEVGCLGLSLLATGVPDEDEPVVKAAAALENQIFKPILGSAWPAMLPTTERQVEKPSTEHPTKMSMEEVGVASLILESTMRSR